MEWWYVQCPLHRCSEDMFCSSENACWAWLQYHLMSSTSGLVPHPRDDIEAMHKAMQESTVRKLTDQEIHQWSDWQKEKGKRSSSKEGAELVEVKEEDTESKQNRSSLQVNIHQLHRHRHELQRGQGLNRHLPHQKSSTRGSSTRPK